MKRKLNARIEYAKFLQDTVKEMAKEIQNSRSGEVRKTAEDLDEFMNKVILFHFFPFHWKSGKLVSFFTFLMLGFILPFNRLEKASVFLMMRF